MVNMVNACVRTRLEQINDAIGEAGTFSGEGIGEVEGLMSSAGMDDVVRK